MLRTILADMRAHRRETFATLAETPESRMELTNIWRRQPDNVRFFFLRFADHEEEHALQIAAMLQDLGFQQTRAQRILGAAEVTRGELLAALVGLSDADLDLTPQGEWPLRRTLTHVIQVERSYTRATTHSIDLYRAGLPYERHQPVAPEREDGDLASFLSRLDAAREAALESLSGLIDADLPAPSIWADRDVDANFRLLRFAHHEREHTAHIRKWRRQVGRMPTEAQHLLGLGWRARGVLQSHLVGVPDALLDADTPHGDGTIRRTFEHIVGSEKFIRRQIETAQ
jgi:uncharacterized damage-inducible protein DinB